MEFRRMTAAHAPAVLTFELQNRDWFARMVTDRGSAFFGGFDANFTALLAEQEAGGASYSLLLAEDGSVLGRFNLRRIRDGRADLGYRVAEAAGGRGVATHGVRLLCARAASEHGLRSLHAAAADANPASVRVLLKNGFDRLREADPADLGGATGAWYVRRIGAERSGADDESGRSRRSEPVAGTSTDAGVGFLPRGREVR